MSILHNSKGDTIVEVLIALTILGSILVGAFSTATRAQNASQASQERGEAIKIAESQIERMKGLLASSTPPDPATDFVGPFCIKNDNTIEPITSPANPFSEALETATLPYTGASTPISDACGNKDGRYNVAIQTTSANNYEFLVRWDRIGGGWDQINMYYRVY